MGQRLALAVRLGGEKRHGRRVVAGDWLTCRRVAIHREVDRRVVALRPGREPGPNRLQIVGVDDEPSLLLELPRGALGERFVVFGVATGQRPRALGWRLPATDAADAVAVVRLCLTGGRIATRFVNVHDRDGDARDRRPPEYALAVRAVGAFTVVDLAVLDPGTAERAVVRVDGDHGRGFAGAGKTVRARGLMCGRRERAFMSIDLLLSGLLVVAVGGGLYRFARPLARFSEQLDAIGSTTSADEVEPADWKVWLYRVIAVLIVVAGVGLFGEGVIAYT